MTLSIASSTSGEPAEDDRYFEIGSLTKVMLGVVLAQLVLQGRVRLEDPILKYSPVALGELVSSITLLDLATHTAGLPRLPQNMEQSDSQNPYADFTEGRLWSAVGSISSGQIVEGRGMVAYSNFGAGLLGCILARAASQSLAELIKERVFAPLQMSETFLALSRDEVVGGRIAPGHTADGQPTPNWTFDAMAGCGAVVSTLADLAKFLQACVDVSSAKLGEAMTLAMTPKRGDRERVGLFWMENDFGISWHNGRTYGYCSSIAVDRRAREGIVAVWNAASSLDDICLHALRPTEPVKHFGVTIQLSDEAAERFCGVFKTGASEFRIAQDEKGFVYEERSERVRLYAVAGDTLEGRTVPYTLRFSFAGDSKPISVEVLLDGRPWTVGTPTST